VGGTTQSDIRREWGKVRRRPGESIESVAAKLYEAQMRVYGREGPFEWLPESFRAQWIALAKIRFDDKKAPQWRG
jgi:hypothetical protein